MPPTITLTLDAHPGAVYPCTLPYSTAPAVNVDSTTRCPVCANLTGIYDERGVLRALTRPGRITEAKKDAETEWGKCTTVPPDPAAPFQVRMPHPNEEYDGWTGRAECHRCRSTVGTLTVKVCTMYGIEEDRRVTAGIWRVY